MIVSINQAVIENSQFSSYKSWLSPQSVIRGLSVSLANLKKNNVSEFVDYADLILRLKGAINSIATAINASLSERTYLSACVDIICGRVKSINNNSYAARITAKDIKKYVGLSQSACSIARKALQTKGVITVDGDIVDISKYVAGVSDVLDDTLERVEDIKKNEGVVKIGNHLNVNVNFNNNKNINIENPLQKKRPLKIDPEKTDDLFSRDELLSILKHSPILIKAIEDHFSMALNAITTAELIKGMPPIVHAVLSDGTPFCYRTAWNIAFRTHGINAFWYLVLALEGKTTHAGRWFFTMIRKKDVDLQAAIQTMLAAKEREKALKNASTEMKKNFEEREQRKNLQTKICKEFLTTWRNLVGERADKLVEDYYLCSSIESHLYLTVQSEIYKFSYINLDRNVVKDVNELIKITCDTLNIKQYVFVAGAQCGIGVKALAKYE